MSDTLFPDVPKPTPKPFTRFAVLVERSNGEIELLSYLHHTALEAEHQAQGWRDELAGVKVRAVMVNIEISDARAQVGAAQGCGADAPQPEDER